MFEVFAHSDLPHQFVLVAIHSSQLTNVSKRVLKTVGQLESIDVAKAILNMRVNYEFS